MREKITSPNVAPPVGAYSHGYAVQVGTGRLIFVTGQLAIDHQGQVVSPDVAVQTRFVFERIQEVLEEAGSSIRDIVKVQIFLTDIKDFPVVSLIRNDFFAAIEPASTLVAVSALVIEGCKVEVEAVAFAQ